MGKQLVDYLSPTSSAKLPRCGLKACNPAPILRLSRSGPGWKTTWDTYVCCLDGRKRGQTSKAVQCHSLTAPDPRKNVVNNNSQERKGS